MGEKWSSVVKNHSFLNGQRKRQLDQDKLQKNKTKTKQKRNIFLTFEEAGNAFCLQCLTHANAKMLSYGCYKNLAKLK